MFEMKMLMIEIANGSTEERKEGRKEGKKEGRKKERKEGRKEINLSNTRVYLESLYTSRKQQDIVCWN